MEIPENIQQQLNKVNAHIDLSDSTNSVNNLNKAGADLNLTYQAAYSIFSKSIGVITSMIGEVKELDSAITEFKKVSDLSGAALDNYVQKSLSDSQSDLAKYGIRPEIVDEIAEAIRTKYNNEEVVLVDIHELTSAHSEWFEKDGIHPNKDGAKCIANKFADAIKEKN